MNKQEELKVVYDKNVYGINKFPYNSYFNVYKNMDEFKKKDSSLVKSLNGKWNVKYYDGKEEHTTEILDVTEEVVSVTTPQKEGKVNVPCNLELEGFGDMQYVNSQYPWDGHEDVKMGEFNFSANPYYELSREFLCPEKVDMKKPGAVLGFNKDYQYILDFEGVEGQAFIYINDQFVGYTENSFSPAKFDITKFIGPKNNILVRIYKRGTASYLEDQDFWRFTGIFRDVNLIKLPKANIFDVKVDYTLSDDYKNADVEVKLTWNEDVVVERFDEYNVGTDVEVYSDSVDIADLSEVEDGEGSYTMPELEDDDKEVKLQKSIKDVAKIVIDKKKEKKFHEFEYAYILNDGSQKEYGKASGDLFNFKIENPKLWSAETPFVYALIIKVKGEFDYIVSCEFGLTDFAMVDGVMKLNGKRIMFKGVDRHEFSGYRGRAITKEDMEWDVKFMKKNNINAVRTSHYPNSPYFYSLCNNYGIYVIDEANLETHGSWMQAQTTNTERRIPGDDMSWMSLVLDRAKSLYERDKNQPCVLIWSCGNESNGGKVIFNMSEYFRKVDKKRLVHYEGIFHDRTYNATSDMESQMYTKPQDVEKYLNENPEKPFISCEYMHAMGNSLGGMKLYTDLEKYDKYQGGFIWDFIDQNIISKDGKVLFGGDFDDRPCDYNFCGDGIVFADRSSSPKVVEVKKLYQNVKITPDEDGVLIKNDNLFVDLSDYYFTLEILKNGIEQNLYMLESVGEGINVKPQSEQYFKYDAVIDYEVDYEEIVECFDFSNDEYEKLESDNEDKSPLKADIDKEKYEYTFRVSAHLKNNTKWAEAGYEVAFGEYVCGNYKSKEIKTKKFKVIDGDYNIGVKGEGFSYLFSKQTGSICSIKKKDKEFLRLFPMPTYWRAITDNDRGNGLEYKSGIYKLASMTQIPIDMDVEAKEDRITINYTYKFWAVMDGVSTASYTVYTDGTIDVNMKYFGLPNGPSLPEFGLEIPIVKDIKDAWYYGYGPEENYIDRCNGVKLGLYDIDVNSNLTQYARPQECANRTGVRKLQIHNDESAALTFEMIDTPFEFSFLPNSTYEIDNAIHIHELPKSDCNTLKILAKQMGVGGDDSWGAPVHDEFLIDGSENLEFNFRIY